MSLSLFIAVEVTLFLNECSWKKIFFFALLRLSLSLLFVLL